MKNRAKSSVTRMFGFWIVWAKRITWFLSCVCPKFGLSSMNSFCKVPLIYLVDYSNETVAIIIPLHWLNICLYDVNEIDPRCTSDTCRRTTGKGWHSTLQKLPILVIVNHGNFFKAKIHSFSI